MRYKLDISSVCCNPLFNIECNNLDDVLLEINDFIRNHNVYSAYVELFDTNLEIKKYYQIYILNYQNRRNEDNVNSIIHAIYVGEERDDFLVKTINRITKKEEIITLNEFDLKFRRIKNKERYLKYHIINFIDKTNKFKTKISLTTGWHTYAKNGERQGN